MSEHIEMEAPQIEVPCPRLPVDYAVHRRAPDGSREAWTSAFSVGVPQAVPFRDTWTHLLLKEAAERAPAEFAALADHHDHILSPSILSARDAEAQELARLERENEEARAANAPLHGEIEALKERLETDRARSEERLGKLADELREVRREAWRMVALAGGTLDLGNPTGACLAPPPSRTPEEVCAERGWPWPGDDDSALLIPWLSWALTGATATALGLSLLSMAGAVSLDSIGNEPPVVVGFGIALGLAATTLGGYAVRIGFQWASQNYYLGHLKRSWAPILVTASLLAAGIVGIDAAVDQQGLLRLAALHTDVASLGGSPSGGNGPNGLLLFVGSLALSLPYVAYQAGVGSLKGRVAVRRRAEAEAASERREKEREHNARPDVQAAREALAGYCALLAAHQEEESRAQGRWARIEHEIWGLESKLRPIQHEISQPAAWRVQDQLDQALGNEIERQRLDRELRLALLGVVPRTRPKGQTGSRPRGWRGWFSRVLGSLKIRTALLRKAITREA